MSKKKIIIYEFQDIRFASRARKEAFSLQDKFDVELVGFNREIIHKKVYFEEKIKIVEFTILFKNSKSFLKKSINIFLLNFKIGRYVIGTKSDVYLMHNLKLFYPSLIAKFFHKAYLVYDAHELHMAKREGNSLKQKILTKYDIFKERILAKKADLIFEASELRAQYFSEFYKVKKPIVLENNARFIRLQNYKGKNIREILKLRKNDKIIIFTGFISIGGNQRIDNVIRSLKYLNKNVYFCVLGFGNDSIKSKLFEISKEFEVSDRFHFIPPVKSKDVVPYISGANVAVIPILANSLNSRYSALNKVSQSLMAGLPLASSNYENLIETVLNNPIGKVGNVFDVNDPKKIAIAINDCLHNEKLYRKNSLQLAEKYINWEREEKKLNTAIDSLFIN